MIMRISVVEYFYIVDWNCVKIDVSYRWLFAILPKAPRKL